jgi:hypothetical protein
VWDEFGSTINNSFYFVVDKISDLQGFFRREARGIGSVVLLIAILSAALNYALTGTGLKENIIKILKATLFFLIVIAAYPRIVSFITSWTFSLARQSVYPSIERHFNETVGTVEEASSVVASGTTFSGEAYSRTLTNTTVREIRRDSGSLIGGLTSTTSSGYTVVAPTALLKVLFFISGECFKWAETEEIIIPEVEATGNAVVDAAKNIGRGARVALETVKTKVKNVIPNIGAYIKGYVCGFFIIFTGVFALLEYIICYLEFMLVASVGIIMLPLSIWDGSKFIAEKFIGALLGFFIKLLLCNIAIFLLIYGFISLFYIISATGFVGTVDQMIFIFFTCLMFFFICKSAPSIAQSLLTGAPSLNGAGAISAVAGAFAAIKTVTSLTHQKPLGAALNAGIGTVGTLKEANAARNAVKSLGGDAKAQRGAFFSSLGQSAWDNTKAGALGLTRSLMGINNGPNPHSWKDSFATAKNANGESLSVHEHYDDRRAEGAKRGGQYAGKHKIAPQNPQPTESPAPSVSGGPSGSSSGTTTA